jgi:hypothetical protein
MQSIGDLAIKVPQRKKKKGGINCALTEIRTKTSDLIKFPLGAVCAITKGFTADELYRLLRQAESFKPNPAAVWWIEFKKIKHAKKAIKRSPQVLRRVREERRNQEQAERQQVLF